MPLLLFSALVNTRTSIFLFLICLVAITITALFSKKLKQVLSMLSVILIIGIVLLILLKTVSQSNEATYKWIEKGFEEVNAMLQGEQEGYFVTLFGKFIKFPEGLHLIWGEGISLFGKPDGSDVGIINTIWIGGILLAIWIYLGFITFYLNRISRVNYINKSILIVIVLSFLIANVKGLTIYANEFTNASLLITGFIIYMSKNENENMQALNVLDGKNGR